MARKRNSATAEGPELEWKVRLPRPERIAALFAAFANGVGGRLEVGIRDDGTAAGVDDPAAVKASLRAIAAERVVPPVAVKVAQTDAEGAIVIEAVIAPAEHGARPVRAIVDADLVAYVRDDSKTRRASKSEERALASTGGAVAKDRLTLQALAALARAARPTPAELARSLRWSPRRLRRVVMPLMQSGCVLVAEDRRLWITPKGHRVLAATGGRS